VADQNEEIIGVLEAPGWRLIWKRAFLPRARVLRRTVLDPTVSALDRDKAAFALDYLREGFRKVYDEAGYELPDLLKEELGVVPDD